MRYLQVPSPELEQAFVPVFLIQIAYPSGLDCLAMEVVRIAIFSHSTSR